MTDTSKFRSAVLACCLADIKFAEQHIEDAAAAGHPLRIVRTLKSMHGLLGGMAIHTDDETTLQACQEAIALLEDGLARAKAQLKEVQDDRS